MHIKIAMNIMRFRIKGFRTSEGPLYVENEGNLSPRGRKGQNERPPLNEGVCLDRSGEWLHARGREEMRY